MASLGGVAVGAVPYLSTANLTIGMWCGIPPQYLSYDRVAEVAAAGLTVASGPCEGTPDYTYNSALASYASSLPAPARLSVLVTDSRAVSAGYGDDVSANVAAVAADYSPYPAVSGYYLRDEPPAQDFPPLANATSAFRAADPSRPAYVNLLPNYASAQQLGTATYAEYVELFAHEVAPAVTSYDFYNFYSDGSDSTGFFSNLEVFRSVMLEYGSIEWWLYIQAIEFSGHRATSEEEKRWAAMHTIAYGACGVCYFTYWTPPQTSEEFGEGIIAYDGTQTVQYPQVQRINAKLAALGAFTCAASSKDVWHNGELSPDTHPRPSWDSVYVRGGNAVTVGKFAASDGGELALIVNRDYTSQQLVNLCLASADSAPLEFSTTSNSWVAMDVISGDEWCVNVQVEIDAGDAALVYLKGPVPAGEPGAEAYVGVVRHDIGSLDVVDSQWGTMELRSAGWRDCPSGFSLVGVDFESNGFWLCARSDLSSNTFYLGNVVKDAGTLYKVSGGTATPSGSASWNTCPDGSTLLGTMFDSNGFWLCCVL
ncbi:hypothetical protein Pelo_8145 [Pelomyxa schiedti]|nr:hypothetical protein Pelo_12201 [Pelomyxa schiedti]KAH3760069.1 hypothetical protein Pelo_8145 [Pelomyxa schiedti]